ncbi:serpin family protein [Brachybacterium paraconglomeratum]|uniref:serpin family protein n=1 Tax=Brachybacterium paraconglomeratum TaxID=173362 RepID=UPI0022DFFB07|nr:serpin family protein [Brachybacterium paraconglomeratum]
MSSSRGPAPVPARRPAPAADRLPSPPRRRSVHAPPRRSVLAAAAALPLAGAGLSGCGALEGIVGDDMEPDLVAELPRRKPGETDGLGRRVVPFAAHLLAGIDREPVNAVCSPLSAQTVLTMAALGAAGDTLAQMEEVLGGTVDELATTANTLSAVLAAVGDAAREEDDPEGPEPAVASLASSTWLQESMTVEQGFLDGLAEWFGSGVFQIDVLDEAAREKGRERINDWVAEQTNDLIEDLVPEQALSDRTRAVLVNALHLKAAWPSPLERRGGTFTTDEGEELSVELLHGSSSAWFEDSVCRATALAAAGGELALALVQPAGSIGETMDAWAEVAGTPAAGLGGLLDGLEDSSEQVDLAVPPFDIAWDSSLVAVLESLGMTEVFSKAADLSGITAEEDLMITEILQKAVITVDEEGMEAAAATAVAVGETAAPAEPKELVLDRPFLFVAYERSTRAPLVAGWIGDPTQTR